MDDLDRALLTALINNARTSMRKLAKQLNVAPGTVAARMRRLEDEGVVHGYAPLLNATAVGWEFTIIVGLRIIKGRLLEVQEKIGCDSRVVAIYDVTGEVDSLIVARMRDREDLDDFTKTVLSTEGVERSITHVVLNTVKENLATIPKQRDG